MLMFKKEKTLNRITLTARNANLMYKYNRKNFQKMMYNINHLNVQFLFHHF